MPNYRFRYFLIWTSALMCLTVTAPVRDRNILSEFIATFRGKCSVFPCVVLPRYKDTSTHDLQNYNLTVPLEVCTISAESDPTWPLCQEAFYLITSLSTCNPDIKKLNSTVYSIASVNISIQVDNVCKGFAANRNLFARDENFIAFKLADTLICSFVCQGKVRNACSFLLWGYQVQSTISDASKRFAAFKGDNPKAEVGVKSSTSPVNSNAKVDAQNASPGSAKAEVDTKSTSPGSSKTVVESTSPEKAINAGASPEGSPLENEILDDAAADSDVINEREQNTVKPVEPKSTNYEVPVENQDPNNEQKFPVSKVNDNKSKTRSSKPSVGTVSTSEKSASQVLVSVSKHVVTTPNVPHDSNETPVKDGSHTPANAENQKGGKSGAGTKPHSDTPSTDSGAAASDAVSSAAQKGGGGGDKNFASTQSPISSLEGKSVPYLNDFSDDSDLANQEDIPQTENNVDTSDIKNEIPSKGDPSPVREKNTKSDELGEGTAGKISHLAKSTEDVKETESQTPESKVDLQSMDDTKGYKSPSADGDENYDESPPDDQQSQIVVTSVGNEVPPPPPESPESLANGVASNIAKNGSPENFPGQEDTHFFFYFVTIIIFAIGGYVLFHNKQKIFALIIEGRNERKRRAGGSYRKLETK